MRFKKTIFFSVVILITFLIYLFVSDNGINYVVLGDSLATGQNPYGVISGYGYTDYIKDYLEDAGRLDQYIKDYAVSGYTTLDVLDDIYSNREIIVGGRELNLRSVLRESDLVTVSVGANDFIKDMKFDSLKLDDVDYYKNKIDVIMVDMNKLFKEIRKYAKEEIIVVGYYNPFPMLFSANEVNIDNIFLYIDQSYQKLCDDHNMRYVSIYQLFKDNSDFLPNPFDIHPNIKGYEAIARLVIETF